MTVVTTAGDGSPAPSVKTARDTGPTIAASGKGGVFFRLSRRFHKPVRAGCQLPIAARSGRFRPAPLGNPAMLRPVSTFVFALAVAAVAAPLPAQTIVYRPVVPMFAPAAGPYVANYSPVGNYAAVTAFSPPVVQAVPLASVPVPVVDTVPSSSLGNTGYSPLAISALPSGVAPTFVTSARPVTTYYSPSYAVAPAPVAATATVVTAGYAPAVTVSAVPMAPATVVVPLRRGLFGGLRPLRSGYVYPGW